MSTSQYGKPYQFSETTATSYVQDPFVSSSSSSNPPADNIILPSPKSIPAPSTVPDSIFSIYAQKTVTPSTVDPNTIQPSLPASSFWGDPRKAKSQPSTMYSSAAAAWRAKHASEIKDHEELIRMEQERIRMEQERLRQDPKYTSAPDFITLEYLSRQVPWYKRRLCGCLPVWALIVFLFLICVLAGLGVGIGIAVSKSGSVPANNINGAPANSNTISTTRTTSRGPNGGQGSPTRTSASPSPSPTPPPIQRVNGMTNAFRVAGPFGFGNNNITTIVPPQSSLGLLVGGNDGSIREFDSKSPTGNLIRSFIGATTSIVFMEVVPVQTVPTVIAASADGTIYLFNNVPTATGNVTSTQYRIFPSSPTIKVTCGKYDGSDRIYFGTSADTDNTFEFSISARRISLFPNAVAGVTAVHVIKPALSTEGILVIGDSQGYLSMYFTNQTSTRSNFRVSSSPILKLEGDELFLYVSSTDGTLSILNANADTGIFLLSYQQRLSDSAIANSFFTSLDSRNNKFFYRNNGQIQFIDTATRVPSTGFGPFISPIVSLAFLDSVLYVGCDDGVIYQFLSA